MDEKALQYAYELFQADGYTGSVDDFKNRSFKIKKKN